MMRGVKAMLGQNPILTMQKKEKEVPKMINGDLMGLLACIKSKINRCTVEDLLCIIPDSLFRV